jgi:hypothetical protein
MRLSLTAMLELRRAASSSIRLVSTARSPSSTRELRLRRVTRQVRGEPLL